MSDLIENDTASDLIENETAEVGILLVHGIGQQQRGQTLLDFGEPILEWIDRWLTGAVHGPKVYHYCHTQVRRSLLLPDDHNTPPHFEFDMEVLGERSQHTKQKHQWVVAESCWANTFPPPNSREVILWTIKILPVAIGPVFVLMTRLPIWFMKYLGKGDKPPSRLLVHATAVAFLVNLLLVGFATSPLILAIDLVLLVLLLFTYIPIPTIQRYIDWLQLKIAAILGDSYIFTQSEIRKKTIIGRFLEDLAWLESRCKNVTIIAHSQGAAVAYYSLLERIRGPSSGERKVRLLVTFGSGLAKLDELILRRSGGNGTGSYLLVAYIGIPFAALALFSLAFGLISHENTAIAIGFPLMLIFTLFTLGMLVQIGPISARAFSSWAEFGWSWAEWATLLDAWKIHWIDIYASNDPIPAGPLILPDDFRRNDSDDFAGPETHEVRNRGSFISDHTTYFSNMDEFVARVVTSITKHCPGSLPLHNLSQKDTQSMDLAVELRRYRVNFLKIRRWFIILAMLSVVTNTDALSVLGTAVHNVVGTIDRLLEGEIWAPSSGQTPKLCIGAAATGFAVAVLSYGLLMSMFIWFWRRLDFSAFEDMAWRRAVGDNYIGRPKVLSCTLRTEVIVGDYMLRLLPWLGVSIAVTLSFPRLGDWIIPSEADPVYRALGEVGLLMMTLALGDTVLSYLRRRGFVRKLLDVERRATTESK